MSAGTSTEPDGPLTWISFNADHEPSLCLRKSAHVARPVDVTIVTWSWQMATLIIPPVQIVAASTKDVTLFAIIRLHCSRYIAAHLAAAGRVGLYGPRILQAVRRDRRHNGVHAVALPGRRLYPLAVVQSSGGPAHQLLRADIRRPRHRIFVTGHRHPATICDQIALLIAVGLLQCGELGCGIRTMLETDHTARRRQLRPRSVGRIAGHTRR